MSEFQQNLDEKWQNLAQKALKDRPLSDLDTQLSCGLSHGPLEPRVLDAFPIGFSADFGSRRYFERIDHPNVQAAISALELSRKGGATGFNLIFQTAGHAALGFGLSDQSAPDLFSALSNVEEEGLTIDRADHHIRIEAGNRSAAVTTDIQRACQNTPLVCAHPLIDEIDGYSDIRELSQMGNIQSFFEADGRRWHNAGADEVTELALVLCEAANGLRILDHAGLLDAHSSPIGVTLSLDSAQFLGIAKLRAMRLLWARMMDLSGLSYSLHIHCETSWRMMSKLDGWVNMLRTTTATFSGLAGGADSLSVLPFSRAFGLSDGFPERVARNTYELLTKESHIDHVVDPAAGSGSIEILTHDLAKAAWDLFQTFESEGGLSAALTGKMLRSRIETSRRQIVDAHQRGDQTMIGVNAFPSPSDLPIDVEFPLTSTPMAFDDVPLYRVSESFENEDKMKDGDLAHV